MGSRLPVEHYSNSFITTSLHDLNTVDSRPSEIDAVDAADALDHDHPDSASVECLHESYRNSLTIHGVGAEEEDRSSIDNSDSSRGAFSILAFEVHDVNLSMASLSGIRDTTIGVALEAAGGLYRRLAKKFPKKGSYMYKRRELATSLETRTRFPELVIQEEKRVRFVVVNGLDIVERPNNVPVEDAEWFKRLTGRNEVALSAQDYKFYSPRHKYRRAPSNTVSNIPCLPAYSDTDTSPLSNAQGFHSVNENQQQTSSKHHMPTMSPQPQYHPIHQNHHQPVHQNQHAAHFPQNHQCGPPSHLAEINHSHQSPTMSQHIACLQPLTGGHVGGRLHVMPTNPPKYCDECGALYLRETSKFCSECGIKRLGI